MLCRERRTIKNKITAAAGIAAVLLIFVLIEIYNHRIKDTDDTDIGNPIAEITQPEQTPTPGQDKNVRDFYPIYENVLTLTTMEDLNKYLYTIDDTAYITQEDLDLEKYLRTDVTTDLSGKEPKILIFHTHSQEDFIDSREGAAEDTIVGVGNLLASILVEEYNIPVVHDSGKYDFVDGKVERGRSYEKMEPAVKRLLEKYPSVQVTIDLHRDGVPDDVRLVTEIDGKPTAKLMFFNGITRLNNNGTPVEMPDLVNPYITHNMALSLRLQLVANELYPGLMRKIYIKPYRYSLHLRPRSMLVEVGANTNTLEEAKNAMAPLAKIIVNALGLVEK